MNRRRVVAVALAAAVALTAAAGVFGAAGLVPTGEDPADDAAPDTEPPTDTPQVLVHDGDALTLENDPDQVIEGTTGLDAGTAVTVRLQSTNASSPFIKQTTATVDEDGRYEATVDLNDLEVGTQFRATVVHDSEELANVSGEVVEGSVDRNEASDGEPKVVEYEGDALTLQSAPEQAVEGTTDLAAGTEVTVQLRSSGAGQPFLKQATTTVGEDGRLEATFDLSSVEPGAAFTVTVRADGETVDEAPGEVVADD